MPACSAAVECGIRKCENNMVAIQITYCSTMTQLIFMRKPLQQGRKSNRTLKIFITHPDTFARW